MCFPDGFDVAGVLVVESASGETLGDELPAALHASLRDNPTAALLPLLQALARRRAATVPLPLGGPGWLRVALEPR